MEWVVTGIGAVLVVAALRDVFHTLWHPSVHGGISNVVMRTVWAVARRVSRLRGLSGPLALVLTVFTWGGLIVAGWALIYWAQMPDGFVFGSGLRPPRRSDALDALYLSLVTVATLGFGDIVPQDAWLRATTPLQALIGFVLLSGSITWILQVYPALGRRRAFAVRVTMLHRAGTVGQLPELDAVAAAQLLHSLADDLTRLRVDLSQYSETYFFHDQSEAASLPVALGYVAQLSEAAQPSTSADTRLAGETLRHAVMDFAGVLTDQQLVRAGDDVEDVLAAYAVDHGHSGAT